MNLTKKMHQLATTSLVLLGLAGGNTLQAQKTSAQELQAQGSIGSLSNPSSALRSFDFSTIGLKGSPLLLPGWVPGEVTLQSGRQLKTELFNYDVFARQITVKRSATDSIRYQLETVKLLILRPGEGMLPLRFERIPGLITEETALKIDLLRLVYQGTYSLVQLPLRTFIKAPVKQSYDGLNELNHEYRDESAYYLIRPDRTAERVKLTRKSLVRALKEKGPLLENFLKANPAANLANEDDTVRALAALNQN